MKRLSFTKPNNLSLLHDQLLAALPALRPVPNAQGRISDFTGKVELEPIMAVEGLGDEVWLTVPDTANESAIAAVVAAHDPTAKQPDPRGDRLARIGELSAIPRSTWTTAQLRELLELVAQELTRCLH